MLLAAILKLMRLLKFAPCLTLLVSLSSAECRQAQKEDVPHGANMLVELKEKQVNHLFGVMLFENEETAGDVVVEIYSRHGAETFQETVQRTRLAACVTLEDGKFSFAELKPGKYLLRAGTRKNAGVNELYIPIIVKSHWWERRSPGLRLILQVGT